VTSGQPSSSRPARSACALATGRPLLVVRFRAGDARTHARRSPTGCRWAPHKYRC
jgi:hypothetical protein